MGVKDLWSIISPVCERKSLWELQDKTIAIDLSCWVCDSQCISDYTTQPRMYLRNLFFRTNCLLLLGAHPIFVLEGAAPDLKHSTMEKRKNITRKQNTHSSQRDPSKKGNRSRLNSLLSKCRQLLGIMGLSCVQSPGEAEAFCATLDYYKFVDGCITQDGDCFLYGAQTVYRNFTISSSGGSSGSNAGFSIDVYKMSIIEDRLSLGRNDLIAISLLCGCDYNEKGVSGVGKESVLKFLTGVKDKDILDRLKRWRTDSYFDDLENKRYLVSKGILCEVCGHNGRKLKHTKSGCLDCRELKGCKRNPDFALSDPTVVAELHIRKKAIQDPDFPSQKMIDEFLCDDFIQENFRLDKTWKKPDLRSFVVFSCKLLGWTELYAVEKFLPLVTRWQILELQNDSSRVSSSTFSFSPQCIVKRRIVKGIESFEISWLDVEGVVRSIDPEMSIITVEPQSLVMKAYPKMVEEFMTEKMVKKKKVTTKKSASKKTALEEKENSNQIKIDKFFNLPIAGTVQCTQHVLKDNSNIIFKLNEKCVKRNATPLKNDKIKSVKTLSECFSNLEIECCQSSMPNSVRQKFEIDSVSSKDCTHQQENMKYENSKFDKSVWWEDCELCFQDDAINDEDLSFIVESIVNNKHCNDPQEESPKHLTNINSNCQNTICNEDESFDEFDYLANEKYVPLVDRLRSQL